MSYNTDFHNLLRLNCMDHNLTDSMEQVTYRNLTAKALSLLLFTVLAFSFSPNANASIDFPAALALDTVAGENVHKFHLALFRVQIVSDQGRVQDVA